MPADSGDGALQDPPPGLAEHAQPQPAQDPPTVIFRRPSSQVPLALEGGLAALVGLIGVVSPEANWWGRIIFGFLAACAVPATVRICQLSLIAEPGQLVIRNFRKAHRVSWSQIVDISLPPPGSPRGAKWTVRISLADGAVIPVTLYGDLLQSFVARDIRTQVVTSLKELQRQRA